MSKVVVANVERCCKCPYSVKEIFDDVGFGFDTLECKLANKTICNLERNSWKYPDPEFPEWCPLGETVEETIAKLL